MAKAGASPASSATNTAGSLIGLIPGIGGIASALIGLIGGQDSPQDEATKYIMEQLKAYLPTAGKTPYSKSEVGGLVDSFKESIGTSTDIAKTGIATSLAEGMGAAGVPEGQPQGSMYTSELAPLDANAVTQKAGIDKWGAEFWASLDESAKNRVLSALGTGGGLAGNMPSMTGTQKGLATFLQAINLLSTGGGNLAKMFKDINWQPIDPTGKK